MSERCAAVQVVAGKRFRCVRDDHGWANKYAEDYYRERRKAIEPDRHVFVKETR